MTKKVKTLRERMAELELRLDAQHNLLTQLSETLLGVLETAVERDKKTSEVLNKMVPIVGNLQQRELERATAHWAPRVEKPSA